MRCTKRKKKETKLNEQEVEQMHDHFEFLRDRLLIVSVGESL